MIATVSTTPTALVIEKVLDTPIDAIWRVLSVPALHVAADASDMLRGARSPRPIEALGDQFTMDMQHGQEGAHYVTVNTVSDFIPGRSIGWIVNAPDRRLGWGWRYDLTAVRPGGTRTRVRLTYHWGDASPEALASIGVPMPAIPAEVLERGLELLEVEAALTPAPDVDEGAPPVAGAPGISPSARTLPPSEPLPVPDGAEDPEPATPVAARAAEV
ncbi:hypothetical protein ACPYO6_08685 [Georgenia sp. Z1344]|uniref:hypothetical protein n=1 Tax=Georgenia sp. Z1344 TaxID=3416706 RepID=UPI003CECDCF3